MKKNDSKISIIIPMYNVEKYLRRCLDSVKNQTFQDWTAICIDDGSPDNSGKIAEEYAQRDKRFVVIHKENGGVSDARNVGMKKVKSEYVMFLDSDDCIHPQALEILNSLSKDADIVSFKYIIEDTSTLNMPEWFNKKYDVKKIKNIQTKNLLRFATNYDTGNKSWYVEQCYIWPHLYRYDFIKKLSFLKGVSLYEDFVFWSKVLFRKPRAVITKLPLYSYTVNPDSAVHTSDNVKSCRCTLMALDGAFSDKKKDELSWLDYRRWSIRFLWVLIVRLYIFAKRIDDENILIEINKKINRLKDKGMFDNPPDLHACRYRKRLFKLFQNLNT